MKQPKEKVDSWISIGEPTPFGGVDGYVFSIYEDGSLSVGYYQNNLKAIKQDVVWNGDYWEFRSSELGGSYLKDREEYIVKKGRYGTNK